MHLDENYFFREAAARICGNLDIQKSMRDCAEFIKKFVPVSRMYLQLFDPNRNVLEIISSVIRKGKEGTRFLHIPEEYKATWLNNWEGFKIINDPRTEPWLWKDMQERGDGDLSFLLIRLKIDDLWFCWLALVTEGKDVFTEEHARLMLLLQKPFTIAVANALRHGEVLRLQNLLARESRHLYKELTGLSTRVIGQQSGLKEVMHMCNQIAPLDCQVLLLGETGVGKDLLANVIHNLSPREKGPFISVNCGALSETLIDSELFGHEKGAFTGADRQNIGRFERADKGTIFLDEIGDLPSHGQVRLLHVLQYKEFERVGGKQPIPVDIRIIAATNKNLDDMVESGKFRRDLWYRLNVFPINIPPLRQRKSDIPKLLYYFIEKGIKKLKLDIVPTLQPDAIDKLMTYDWPGNVRELENIVERALITNSNGLLRLKELFMLQSREYDSSSQASDSEDEIYDLNDVISMHIRKILKVTAGKIAGIGGAAELLGIHPNTLRKKMEKLEIPYKRNRKRVDQ